MKIKNISRLLIICLLAFILTVTIGIPVMAFDARTGSNITVPDGEVVEGDLYLAGGDIVINGIVNGDVFGAGQSLTINGTVNGGVTFAGQNITVDGHISRGIRIAGQTINIGGNIERDLVLAGSTVNLDQSATIGGGMIMAAQTSTIEGDIGGDLKAVVNDVTIDGSVAGNVNITGSDITIASSADINGDLTYFSNNDADIQSGATIGGEISHKQTGISISARNFFVVGVLGTIIGRVLAFLMLFVIGVILIFTIPGKMTELADSIRTNPGSSLGWGALLFFVTPIAALLVMFTVIGIPLGIISLVLWGISVYLAQIPVALIIGWLILRNGREIQSKGIMIGSYALGLFILILLTAIPVFGWIVGLFIVLFGMGTLISSCRRRHPATVR